MSAGSTRPKRLATERLPERGLLFGLPIVTSKLVAPPLPIGFTPRPRVAGALAGAAGTVCIVLAPAGYGKTTATVEEVAGEGAENVAWLSIDAYDSTELSFWAHLAASIDMVRPGVLRAMVDANEQSPVLGGGRLAASLLAALDGDEGLVVVLDDLHHLRSRALWEQLGFFLERLPPGIRVIATTRTVTPLPVERWRSQGRATVVDEQILRFDAVEAAGLIAGVSDRDVSSGEVAELVARSEGWAVGLVFEALAGHTPAATGAVRSEGSPKPSRTVINYLATEVLDTLGADDRGFLLSISVLDEFDNELCRRVTGEVDAGLRLRSLRVANLFLVPVDEAAGRFRFHHLFRELLLEVLDRRDPGRRIELHRRAAEAAGAAGAVPVQIHHLLEAGEVVAAFDLMVRHALRVGSLATARELIASFPDGFVLEDPRRMLDYVLVQSLAGDWEMAEQWCDRAESALVEDSGPLRARLELHRALSFVGHGEAQAALDALESSRAARGGDTRPDALLDRFSAVTAARVHVLIEPDPQAASFWLEEARKLGPEVVHVRQISIPTLTAFLRLWAGDLVEAERLARQALTAADQLHIPLGLHAFEALLVLTDVLIETARLAEAVSVLEHAEEIAGQLAPLAGQVHVALRRVEITAATQGPASGADAAARARARFNDQRLGAPLIDALTARHAYWLLAEGRTIEASKLSDTLPPGPPRSILRARLAALEHQWQVATCLLADSAEWPAAESMEAELIRSGADCYRGVSEVLERTGGFVWSVVKQGQPLLLHLESLGDEATPSVMRVLESAAAFSPAFRPVRFGEVGVRFTERERTLLQLLPSHLSYAEIAAELYLSVNTVKSNLKTLYRKLGVSSRSEAVRRARAAKLG